VTSDKRNGRFIYDSRKTGFAVTCGDSLGIRQEYLTESHVPTERHGAGLRSGLLLFAGEDDRRCRGAGAARVFDGDAEGLGRDAAGQFGQDH
jgi:hypothetical protein